MRDPVRFFVRGVPEPAGSKRAVSIPGRQFTQVVDANRKAEPWKKTVKAVAAYEMAGRRIFEGPLGVRFVFHFKRPAGHLLTDGWSLAAAADRQFRQHTKKPDALKCARAVEDAMTGTVYVDDAQIVDETIRKVWSNRNGVDVLVWQLLDERDDYVFSELADRAA